MRRSSAIPCVLLVGLWLTGGCRVPSTDQDPVESAGPNPRRDAAAASQPERHPGLRVLYEVPMQSFSLTRGEFSELWRQWPDGARREHAMAATATELPGLVRDYYGLHIDPLRGDVPTAFAADPERDGDPGQTWTLNCLACHGGALMGEFLPGLGNNTLMLEDLVSDVARSKGARRTQLEEGMLLAEMGNTIGVTEAVLFSELLLALRGPDLELGNMRELMEAGLRGVRRLQEHPEGLLPLDAPPWWLLSQKSHLYFDHSVAKNHRTPMQFLLGFEGIRFGEETERLLREGSGDELRERLGRTLAEWALAERGAFLEGVAADEPAPGYLRAALDVFQTLGPLEALKVMPALEVRGISRAQLLDWDDELRAVYDFALGLEAPDFPGELDVELAARGQALFEAHCADCHGSYAEGRREYRVRRIPLDEIGTDPQYPQALDQASRDRWKGFLNESEGGAPGHELLPDEVADRGYVPPALNGVWASAPYLHNGSVPTLAELLDHAGRAERIERGAYVWSFRPGDYDLESVGLRADFLEGPELGARDDRRIHDDERFGMGAAGHPFGDELGDAGRRAVLEYLKTL